MRSGTAGRTVQVGAPAQHLRASMPRHACMHLASEWLGAAGRLCTGATACCLRAVRGRDRSTPCCPSAPHGIEVARRHMRSRQTLRRGAVQLSAHGCGIALARVCWRGALLHKTGLWPCRGLWLPSKRGCGESRCRHGRQRQGASRTTRSNVHATLGRCGGWCRCRLVGPSWRVSWATDLRRTKPYTLCCEKAKGVIDTVKQGNAHLPCRVCKPAILLSTVDGGNRARVTAANLPPKNQSSVTSVHVGAHVWGPYLKKPPAR